MSKAKLEYIWLDGYKPTQSLRSKTMVVSDFGGTLDDCKMWSFDGSSTEQAAGNDSDCLLKPVALYPDPDKIGTDNWLVMCEVLNADGTPHESNGRATIDDDRAKAYADSFPVQRLGQPSEVADLVSFLVSNAAAYITGAAIDINGGDLMV